MADPGDHRHCKVCGKMCDSGEQFCSPACERKRADALRSRRNLQNLMYAGIAILLILLAVNILHV